MTPGMKKFGFCVVALALSACGDANSENFQYEYEVNGCKTGAHSFDSKQSYCEGLKDDSLNNGCAYSIRKEEFRRQCSGQSW